MSLRSSLGQVRGLGSAKEGVGHWWDQRITAIALLPLIIWFVASIAFMAGADHGQIKEWIGNPFTAVLLVVMLIALFYHMKLGMQVVIEDYVHHKATKLVMDLMNLAAAFLLGGASILAVIKLAVSS